MFFLVRVAFWLSIVILLLPTGRTQAPGQESQLAATDALLAAGAALADMRQFCTRQPDACETGSQAIVAFGHKAQAGAKMLYELLTGQVGQENGVGRTGSTRPADATSAQAADTIPSRTTLTPADRIPAWRGPPTPAPRPEHYARRTS